LKYLIMIAVILLTSPATAQVQIRDADTIVVSGTPVRLNGVDAPELGTQAARSRIRRASYC